MTGTIDVKNVIAKFSRRVILLFFISSVLLTPACGSENNSSNGALLEAKNEKTDHDHSEHNHGGHDHHSDEDVIEEGKETSSPDISFKVEIAEGKVKGGLSRFEVSKGDSVEVIIHSDQIDEVHLHVYDKMKKVEPDVPAIIRLDATIPGIFEAELHSAGFRIFELQVS